MANFIEKALAVLDGRYLHREEKFAPHDATVNWQYIQHLVYTANTVPFGQTTADGNSAVFACLRALAYAGIEAPLQAVKVVDGENEPQPTSQLQLFLDEPHPILDMEELRFWTYWARHLDGNAYLIKVRSGDALTGNPVELWPASPLKMEPVTERGSRRFIDFYKYKRDDGRGDEFIPVENVLHFKLGTDPMDPRRGISPLRVLLREIATDAEATRFSQALLANFGIPGVVVKLPIEAQPGPQAIADLKDSIKREFGGEARGKVGVITGGADMEQFGFSPNDMNLKSLHDFPETRIAAVMGVDPLVARLGVGLEQTSNYASSRQVRENFTELTIIPQWRMDERRWTRGLARDFSPDRNIRIIHDLNHVRALQEDENEKFKRYDLAWRGGGISREEFRTALGYDPEIKVGDVLFVPSTAQYVEVGKELTDPEAEKEAEREANAERLAAVAAKPPAGPDAAKSRTEGYSDVLQSIVDKSVEGFAADYRKLQESQKRRVQKALVNGTIE